MEKSKKKERSSNNETMNEETNIKEIEKKELLNKETENETNDFKRIENVNKTYDDYILNLKIISKLRDKDKLSIQNEELTIDYSYIPFLSRFFRDDSRIHTINYLKNLDVELNGLIENIMSIDNESNKKLKENKIKESSTDKLLNLSYNLSLSLVGLQKLRITYSNDDYIVSLLEILIGNFELKIRKISELLQL
jgi:hypothetical protein